MWLSQLTNAERSRIVEAAAGRPAGDRLLVRLAVGHGLSPRQSAALSAGDVTDEGGTLVLTDKYGARCRPALSEPEASLARRLSKGLKRDVPLFVTSAGRPRSAASVRALVLALARAAGVVPRPAHRPVRAPERTRQNAA